MKELLTKKFWRDVKKTFEDARADPPPQPDAAQIPAAAPDAAGKPSSEEPPPQDRNG